MPLRDHFHGPLSQRRHWESLHGIWPGQIIHHLNKRLPPHYHGEAGIHLGAMVEVDVAAFEEDQENDTVAEPNGAGGGVATAVWAPPRPAQTLAVDLPAQDVFEVRIYDDNGFRLVAAVELVSPANKDRPAHRRAFAAKCAAYLQQQVSVTVVDIVTERQQNLHVELMELLERPEAALWPADQLLYAVAYRTTKEKDAWRLDLWPEALEVGRPLPTLPLWLASDLAVPLELEASYEETCQTLRIR